mgnify:CR=1 FL=1
MRLHAFLFAGTILSVISIWLLPKDYIGTHLYVGMISLAAVVGLLIIGACSANMKSASGVVTSGGGCTAGWTFLQSEH